MSFTYEEKKLNSQFVEKIWHTMTTSRGVYTAKVDGNWDIIISRSKKTVYVAVNGIGKKAAKVPYEEGVESIGIAFKPGVFLCDYKGKYIVESQHTLRTTGDDYVIISEIRFKIPDFNSAEKFVDALARAGLLLTNEIVLSFTEGTSKFISDRSLRRHVSNVTGLNPHFLRQVKRARFAIKLLQQNNSIAQAAFEAGFTDQAHMTKSIKLLTGYTPSEIASQKDN